MLKKIFLIFASMTTSLLATDQFNPEHAEFSQMGTLKTWVASQYHSDETMKAFQRNVAMEVPENNFSYHLVSLVRNNEKDKRFFGKTSHVLSSIQLPFLQYVHEISKQKQPVVLEIAAGNGLVTWKIPYAFENSGTVYANELSSVMLENEFTMVIKNRLKDELQQCIHKIPGDCFNIVDKHPEIIGKVDAIYVQNLEHFFNPEQHQNFLKLLDTLLANQGKAFLTSMTMPPASTKTGNPLYELYIQKKASETYPGFMKTKSKCITILESGGILGDPIILEASRPANSTPCSTTTLEISDPYLAPTQYGLKQVKAITQEVVSQFFTPTIYKNSIVPHQSLRIVESFFMDDKGKRHEKFDKESYHASAIVEKKNQ